MPLHALPSSAYEAFLEWAPEQGVEKTHLARLSVGGSSVTAYVKVYAETCCRRGGANRGLVNEALGYLIAEAAKVSVPTAAGVIVLDGSAGAPVSSPVLAWWSADAAVQSVRAHFNIKALPPNSAALAAAINNAYDFLIKRAEIWDLVAVDELMANIDRNVGNLLMSLTAVTAIDHGRAVTGPCWNAATLDPQLRYHNTMREFLRADHLRSIPALQRLQAACVRVADQTQSALQDVEKWANALLTDPLEKEGVQSFLRLRCQPGVLPQLFGFIA